MGLLYSSMPVPKLQHIADSASFEITDPALGVAIGGVRCGVKLTIAGRAGTLATGILQMP